MDKVVVSIDLKHEYSDARLGGAVGPAYRVFADGSYEPISPGEWMGYDDARKIAKERV